MVTVYSLPNCPNCRKTETLMNKLGISYNLVDLSVDLESRQKVKEMGYVQAPVVQTSTTSWSGFQQAKIESLA